MTDSCEKRAQLKQRADNAHIDNIQEVSEVGFH